MKKRITVNSRPSNSTSN